VARTRKTVQPGERLLVRIGGNIREQHPAPTQIRLETDKQEQPLRGGRNGKIEARKGGVEHFNDYGSTRG